MTRRPDRHLSRSRRCRRPPDAGCLSRPRYHAMIRRSVNCVNLVTGTLSGRYLFRCCNSAASALQLRGGRRKKIQSGRKGNDRPAAGRIIRSMSRVGGWDDPKPSRAGRLGRIGQALQNQPFIVRDIIDSFLRRGVGVKKLVSIRR
jgi:hypothetical protein